MAKRAIAHPAMVALVFVLAVMFTQAAGHDIRISARVEGRQIVGKVYVRGGNAIVGATVKALGPDGRELAATQTDKDGMFRIAIQVRCDHRLLADAGDGHGAEYLIRAALLPDDLPDASAPSKSVPQLPGSPAPEQASGFSHTGAQAPAAAVETTDEQAAIKQLRAEIDDLRQQIQAYQQRIRLLDVLGGIGYILGLTGIAYYWLATGHNRRC